jgi:protein gp37
MPTKIPWTDETWNPFVGCSPVSSGCQHCYAARTAARGLQDAHKGLTGRWRAGRRVFVGSMSDIGHEDLPDRVRLKVWATMALTPRHTYQILTKRLYNLRRFMDWLTRGAYDDDLMALGRIIDEAAKIHDAWPAPRPQWLTDAVEAIEFWPLPNVDIGVTTEHAGAYRERMPDLVRIPAARRFVSIEPMIGPINMRLGDCWTEEDHYPLYERIHQVIVGGETGRDARPCAIEWVRGVVTQCHDWVVPCFVKQLGAFPVENVKVVGKTEGSDGEKITQLRGERVRLGSSNGSRMSEWPRDLWVQEPPGVVA